MGITISMRRTLTVTAMALMLGACASPANIQPGATESETVAKLGRPAVERDLPNGGKRLVYTSQPMGQFAWVTDVDANGKVVSTTQALTSARFKMIDDGLAEGRWTADRLLMEFGPPAEITKVAMYPDEKVWGYRFREDGVWNSLMYVYVDPAGIVKRFHPGPDPMYEPRMMMGM